MMRRTRMGESSWDLTKYADFDEAREIANNPTTDPEILRELIEACAGLAVEGYNIWSRANDWIKGGALRNPNCNPDLLLKYVPESPGDVGKNPALPLILLERPSFMTQLLNEIKQNGESFDPEAKQDEFIAASVAKTIIGPPVFHYYGESRTWQLPDNHLRSSRARNYNIPTWLTEYQSGIVVDNLGNAWVSMDELAGYMNAKSTSLFLSHYDRKDLKDSVGAASRKLPYLGQCNMVRRHGIAAEAFYHEMIRNAKPVTRRQLENACDVSAILDDGEKLANFVAPSDHGYFRSSVDGQPVWFVESSGFEFIFTAHGPEKSSIGAVVKKTSTNKRYRYVGNCTNQSWEWDIHAMQRSGKIIDRADFVRLTCNADRTDLEGSMGYGRDFSIVKDWHVGYYKGVFRGVPAVYMVHSHIEYIFTLDGKIGPATTEDDDEEIGASHGGYAKIYKGYRNKGYTKPLPSPVSVPPGAPIGAYQAAVWRSLQGANPRYKHIEKALLDLTDSRVTPVETLDDMLQYFRNEVSTYAAVHDEERLAFAQEMVDRIEHHPSFASVGRSSRPAYKIKSAESMHRKHPKDFLIHSRAARNALQPGKDYAKVIFEGKLPDGQEWGERMWVKVTGKSGGRYAGKLDGKSIYMKAMKNGTEIVFGPEHVTQIIKDGKYLDFDGTLRKL